eukprot:scaffold3834_cov179-Ochromonas_danica.AAC.8
MESCSGLMKNLMMKFKDAQYKTLWYTVLLCIIYIGAGGNEWFSNTLGEKTLTPFIMLGVPTTVVERAEEVLHISIHI